MSNLSQFIGGIAGARVGDIVELSSDQQIITEGGKTYLKAGVEVLSSDYPNFPTSKINKFNYHKRNSPRSTFEIAAGGNSTNIRIAIDTDGNGVWMLFNTADFSLWRSGDDGVTWTCVYNLARYFTDTTLTGTNPGNPHRTHPSFSNNLIGTWIFNFKYYNSNNGVTYNQILFSEDNGINWQFMTGLQTGQYFGNVSIQPYGRALAGQTQGTPDGVSDAAAGYYSDNFGRTWTALITGDTPIPYQGVLPVWAPDGTYFMPIVGGWDGTTSGAPRGQFIRFSKTSYLSEFWQTNLGTMGAYRLEGLTPMSLAFDSNGFMYFSALGILRRNATRNNYSPNSPVTVTGLSIPTGASEYVFIKASPLSNTIYASNLSLTSFQTSTNGGVSWNSEVKGQPGKYPWPSMISSALGGNNKLIGAAGYEAGTTDWFATHRLGEIYVINNILNPSNSYNLIPTFNKLEKINSSSVLAYSTKDLTLYRANVFNSAFTTVSEPGNTRILSMATNETSANIVISDLTTGQLRYSNNGLWTNGTMNVGFTQASPGANIFIDSVNITQNNAETGFSYVARETTIYYLGFSSDGTKMYTMGTQKGNLDQYALSTAWNPATASYDNKFLDIKVREATPYAGFFKPDGTQFYAVGLSENVHQYTLSTAWDVSTATYNTHCLIASAVSASVTGITFSPNGTFMYINSTGDDRIIQYKLNEAWNVASVPNVLSYTRSTELNGSINDGTSITFSSDGRRLYYAWNRKLYEMGLRNPYDVTSIVPNSGTNYRETPFLFNETTSVVSFIKPDGKRLFVSGHAHDNVYSYEMNTSPSVLPIPTTDRISGICYSSGIFAAVSAFGTVLRSSNNGISWERVYQTVDYDSSGAVIPNRYNGTEYAAKIKMASNGTTILASQYGLYRSTDYANTFSPLSGRNTTEFKLPTRISTNDNGVWAYSDFAGDVKVSYNDGVTWTTLKTPEKLALATGHSIFSTNVATIDVEVFSSNSFVVTYGALGSVPISTYTFMSKNGGNTWVSLTKDDQSNTSSRYLVTGNTLVSISNSSSQGGIQTYYDTIGLLQFKTLNDYLRVE